MTTAVFLGLAALLAAGAVGRRRTRALALALVVWFARGRALRRRRARSRVAAALGHGVARADRRGARQPGRRGAHRRAARRSRAPRAFGAASLALLRFTHGPWGAGLVLGLVAPALARRARRRSPCGGCVGPTSSSLRRSVTFSRSRSRDEGPTRMSKSPGSTTRATLGVHELERLPRQRRPAPSSSRRARGARGRSPSAPWSPRSPRSRRRSRRPGRSRRRRACPTFSTSTDTEAACPRASVGDASRRFE